METWKKAPIAISKETYLVSDSGRVKKLSRKSISRWGDPTKERMMALNLSTKGYHRIRFDTANGKKYFYVHRLVAILFVENLQNKPCVNHKDGIKTNNHYSNLEWCTDIENNEHAVRMGLVKRGRNIKSYVSVRTQWSGRKPIIDLNTGIFFNTDDVADMLGTSPTYVQKMLRGDRPLWATQYRYA